MSEEKKSKNLANCSPLEGFRQFNRIKKNAEKWLSATGILEIRKRKPEGLQTVPDPEENRAEAERIIEENAKKITAQRMKNVSDILDSMLDINAALTIELLALACFIEPEDANNHSIAFYLRNLGEMLSDKDVLAFFTSLARLEQTGILK